MSVHHDDSGHYLTAERAKSSLSPRANISVERCNEAYSSSRDIAATTVAGVIAGIVSGLQPPRLHEV
ncbi:hypothetical protein [Bradyrhizobium sp. LMG 9283]|uniref:hypothetical protein n=1 Tax=Bradyrhizobium sp. LMG 9283 TaxID=592064 RepID=UPI00388E4964